MALDLAAIEISDSRKTNVSIDDPQQEVLFKITGLDQYQDVITLVEASLEPVIYVTSAFFGTRGLIIQSYKVDPIGGGVWHGSAMYGKDRPRKTGDIIFSFDGTGGKEHIRVSKETMRTYVNETVAPEGEAPDFERGIGVDGQNVHGVDVVVPIFKFTLEYYPAAAFVTSEYINRLIEMAGTTNDSDTVLTANGLGGEPFTMAFAEGELLYMGTSGKPRSIDDWELQMHFLASRNETGLEFGEFFDDSGGITKGGHEYVWARFQEHRGSNHILKVPYYAYVERVYDGSNFALLFPQEPDFGEEG